MKINELKVTALPQGPEVKGSSIASPSGIGGSRASNEPKMDLKFKTDIKPVHTDTDPDYRREIAPDGIPQDIYNQLRNKSQERKPESEWNLPSKEPNRYIDKLKKFGKWYVDSAVDAGKSIGRGVIDQVTGLRDFGKRRASSFKQDVMNDDVNQPSTHTMSSRQTLNIRGKTGEKDKKNYASYISDFDHEKGLSTLSNTDQFDGSSESRLVTPGGKAVVTKHPAKGDPTRKRFWMQGPQSWAYDKPKESVEGLNRMRKLAGLMEKDEDVWAYSPRGESGAAARVVKTDHGFQVYVMGPYGWIAQGQPHKSQEEAQEDALSFFEAVSMLNLDNLNEEELLEVRSILELQEEALTEEELNELWPAVAAGAALGLGKYAIDQASKPEEERTYYKLWKRFGPKKDEPKKDVEESEELNEFLPAVAGAAALAGAGYAGYKWLKGLKDKVKDRKDTHKSKIDQALKDSVEPQPWWNDMDSTLQEMKADMLSTSKKK